MTKEITLPPHREPLIMSPFARPGTAILPRLPYPRQDPGWRSPRRQTSRERRGAGRKRKSPRHEPGARWLGSCMLTAASRSDWDRGDGPPRDEAHQQQDDQDEQQQADPPEG